MKVDLRHEFPALANNDKPPHPLAYFDSGASALKPHCVIDAISHFYRHDYSNIHRGLYDLSARASNAYEKVRDIAKNFIHAKDANGIIFTRNATEGFNLIAAGLQQEFIKANTQIIVTDMEHHANLVPWQIVAKKTGATLVSIPLLDNGDLDLEVYKKYLQLPTSIVCFTAVSNVLGTLNPIKKITELAHGANALVMLDAAQMAPHMSIDVQDLNVDFMSISGHKCYGPSGASFVYGKKEFLERMQPYQTGGGMIEQVWMDHATYAPAPQKFEAGTPAIAEVVGLGVALNYLMQHELEKLHQHEQFILDDLVNKLNQIPEIEIIGNPKKRVGLVSFNIKTVHPHDVASLLNEENIAVRAGHHCAMPLHTALNIHASVRASLGVYNNIHDNDLLILGLNKIIKLFGV